MESYEGRNPIIVAEGLGKSFRIYDRKRDRLKQIAKGHKHQYFREYWALRDISVQLRRGEALGIIGRNGSGKSTLLQLVCGTLTPTEGLINVNGRIAALLELGSGFNPEFTGRENVYLNAALLGLSRKQTEERIDRILGFADIGTFVDQPVRTYSSGMVVRLAFGVIANVDADILVIDEALAVGDAYFTQKCMRFIQRFREEGSLLFVSHDANAVLALCDQAILIEGGRMRTAGHPKLVIEQYTKDLHQQQIADSDSEQRRKRQPNREKRDIEQQDNTIDIERSIEKWTDYRAESINRGNDASALEICRFKPELLQEESFGGERATIENVVIINDDARMTPGVVMGGEVVRLNIEISVHQNIESVIVGFILKNNKGLALLGDNTFNTWTSSDERNLRSGEIVMASFLFTLPLLPEGEYSISASVAEGTQRDHVILHWVNDALVLRSQCNNIAAGLAGVAMHSVRLERLK